MAMLEKSVAVGESWKRVDRDVYNIYFFTKKLSKYFFLLATLFTCLFFKNINKMYTLQ